MFAGHLDLSFPLVFSIDDILDPIECSGLIERIETAADRERAPVIGRVGDTGVGEVIDERRTNTRVMFDDASLAAVLFERARPSLPTTMFERPPLGGNERIRLYRYGQSERHSAHMDTPVVLEGRESALTFIVYLNEGFRGGETDFPELKQRFVPKRGRALLFQQRVMHEAEPVLEGIKYVLRTEVMIARRPD